MQKTSIFAQKTSDLHLNKLFFCEIFKKDHI